MNKGNPQLPEGTATAQLPPTKQDGEPDIPWLLAQLEAAQSQAKERAALMREAADRLATAYGMRRESGFCITCGSCRHAADCLVTKLRDAADQAEGEV